MWVFENTVFYLVIVAGLWGGGWGVVGEGSVPEVAQYGLYHLPLSAFNASKGSDFYILFERPFKKEIYEINKNKTGIL